MLQETYLKAVDCPQYLSTLPKEPIEAFCYKNQGPHKSVFEISATACAGPCSVADIRDSVKSVTQPYDQFSHAFTAPVQMFI